MIIGGYQLINIGNIDKCIIEKTIRDTLLRCVNCFINLIDNNMILCGCDRGKFLLYNMETHQNKMIRKSIIGNINDLLKIDCGTFISCSTDKSINVWSFKYKVILS